MEPSIEAALSELDLSAKVRLLAGQDMWTLPAAPEIGLKSIVMSDGPIGVRGVSWSDPGVALPCPTALAATWDAKLARTVGRLLGQEARRKGVHVLLAPTVNLHRAPRGGRHFECYSEDPLLSGVIAVGYASGVQELGVAATAKHFVANDSETERMTVDVRVSEQALRELYLVPFEMLVRSGVWAVMAAYNGVNGATMTEHTRLLRDVLKGEWGFDGVVISDWTAARSTEATALGGLDIAMPAIANPWGDYLSEAVQAHRVPEEVVDEQVSRVLRLASRVGALGPGLPPTAPELDGRAVAREVAARSFVLARNDGMLPLRPDSSVAVIGLAAGETRFMGGGSAEVVPARATSFLEGLREVLPQASYAVGTDPRATLPMAGGPHWSRGTIGQFRELGNVPIGETIHIGGVYTPPVGGVHEFSVCGVGPFRLMVGGDVAWEGEIWPDMSDPIAFLQPPEERVPVKLVAGQPVEVGLSQEAALPAMSMRLGHRPPGPGPDDLIEAAVKAAAAADVAIVVVGTTEDVESEGFDRADLALPGRQDELVERVLRANPRTVAVVNAGAPVLMPWAQRVPALLITWFPGQEAGGALADALLGRVEPGGRLPTTWPRRAEDVPVDVVKPTNNMLGYQEETDIGYRAWDRTGVAPLFPFGHGLGYTTWSYSDLSVNGSEVSVRLRNVGGRAGREIVQVYAGRGTRRWLVAFACIAAAPGETVDVVMPFAQRAFQRWTGDGWAVVRGSYEIHVGHSSADLRLRALLTV